MVYYIEIINFESIRNSICLADFSNGVTQQDLDIMEGVVAGDVWDAHIEHETQKLFVVSFFLRRKKNKNPPLLWQRDRPNRKTKNSTRSRARWPGVRTVYIAFRVSAVIVTVCVFQSATFLLQFDSVFQFFLHSIQIISFGCCCFFLVNHAGCAGRSSGRKFFLLERDDARNPSLSDRAGTESHNGWGTVRELVDRPSIERPLRVGGPHLRRPCHGDRHRPAAGSSGATDIAAATAADRRRRSPTAAGRIAPTGRSPSSADSWPHCEIAHTDSRRPGIKRLVLNDVTKCNNIILLFVKSGPFNDLFSVERQ